MGSGNCGARARTTLVTFNGGALVIWRSLSDYFIYLFVAFPLHRVEPVLGDPLNFIVAAVNFAAVNMPCRTSFAATDVRVLILRPNDWMQF
jgi:hypothetical protein